MLKRTLCLLLCLLVLVPPVLAERDRDAVRAAYLRALSESHVTPYHPEAGTASYWRYSLEAEDGREAEEIIRAFADVFLRGLAREQEGETTRGHFRRGVE